MNAPMPRRPKPTPMDDLVIEGLSGSAQTGPTVELFEDDFEPGKMLERVVPAKSRPCTARVIEDVAIRRKALRIKAEAEAKALAERRAATVLIALGKLERKAEPTLAHNQIMLSNGKVLTVKPGPNAIKRRL